MPRNVTIAIAGNPNCGKTTLFNALTGARQHVGNWPGVTVERKEGHFRYRDVEITVVDLPGIYTLAVTGAGALDEKIANDYLLSGKADVVVNILDATNLERNLYLTTQLLEMRIPLVMAVNMQDLARASGIHIDTNALSEALDCPVVPISARSGEGLDILKAAIYDQAQRQKPSRVTLGYPSIVEEALADLQPHLESIAEDKGVSSRWLALKLLDDDLLAQAMVDENMLRRVQGWQRDIASRSGEDVDILIADARYGFANALMKQAVTRTDRISRSLTERIDRIVLNRILGLPIFLAVMYLMLLVTITFANAFVDFFDLAAGALFVDGPAALLTQIGAPDWLITILPKGIGAGIQTVATFIPIIGFLFLFLTFLEDSGYMARAAFVMDRAMRGLGLPGKAFVPMILGFGCTVPAVLATRTLESTRERILTAMMAPFMSCGARLPVYALFAAAFFPTGGQNVVFALYLIGIGFAVLTGLVLRKTLLSGDNTPFLMELPPYHIPSPKALALRIWDRLRGFLVDAGRVIVIIVALLSLFNSLGTDGSFGHENSGNSVLAAVGKTITPAFAPMGISEDNWPATVGLFTGIFAKEAIVGTLDALYGQMAAEDSGKPLAEPDFAFWAQMKAALATIPANLREVAGSLGDPLGLDIGETADKTAAAEAQGVNEGVFGAMLSRFDGTLGAFAYLLAILLYMPCVAAISTIYRETGRWAIFAGLWTSGLAYGSAVIVYQAGRLSLDPTGASGWILGILTAFALVLTLMWWLGKSMAAGRRLAEKAGSSGGVSP